MDEANQNPEPQKARTIRREVVRIRRVRRQVTVNLAPARAIRLGLRLVVRGLIASGRGRAVSLTLRSSSVGAPPPAAHAAGDSSAQADTPIAQREV